MHLKVFFISNSCIFGNKCWFVSAVNDGAENLASLSVVEIFVLAFCFLFAVVLVIVWQFCFSKKNR